MNRISITAKSHSQQIHILAFLHEKRWLEMAITWLMIIKAYWSIIYGLHRYGIHPHSSFLSVFLTVAASRVGDLGWDSWWHSQDRVMLTLLVFWCSLASWLTLTPLSPLLLLVARNLFRLGHHSEASLQGTHDYVSIFPRTPSLSIELRPSSSVRSCSFSP